MSVDGTSQKAFDCASVAIAAADAEPLGGRMKRLREARGLNQSQLARIISIPPSYISGWESGTRVLGSAFRTDLAKALGVSSQYLATGQGDPCPNGSDEEIAELLSEARQKIAKLMGIDPGRLSIDLKYR